MPEGEEITCRGFDLVWRAKFAITDVMWQKASGYPGQTSSLSFPYEFQGEAANLRVLCHFPSLVWYETDTVKRIQDKDICDVRLENSGSL